MQRLQNKHPHERSAFTMIEMLIVIGIIALLISISGFVIGGFIRSGRVSATKGTIKKINGMLSDRLQAFDMAAEQNRFRVEENQIRRQLQAAGNSVELAEALAPIIVRKVKYRQFFPQTFAEAGITAPAGHDPTTESAEVLYHILVEREVLGVPLADATQFSSQEVADTDGDGLKEFVDSFGYPLRFYRYPTRLIRPGGAAQPATATTNVNAQLTALLMPGVKGDALLLDPHDPYGLWQKIQGYNPVTYETDHHTEQTFHTPLIISAGPDETLGLYEPTDQPNFGNLARPLTSINLNNPGDGPLNDNITNRQVDGD